MNERAVDVLVGAALSDRDMACPECGQMCIDEHGVIVHMNDDHLADFLTIARKLGPATEG